MTDRRTLLLEASDRALRYLDGLNERAVFPSTEALAGLSHFDEPLPEHETESLDTLRLLDEMGSPATVASAGPRYFGFVTGGALPATVAANWMTGAWDQNAALVIESPAAAAIERTALAWLLDVLHLPSHAAGAFVTGATMANFTALAAARHSVLAEVGWDVESQGLFGAPRISVIVGEEAHVTVHKALGLLGLGRERVIRVPVDHHGRMRPNRMPRVSAPAIVCLQAGNVNTGAFDPATEICQMAHASGAWVHVDGAFGLWAAASPERAHLVEGVELADSWATDAHKWLNVPYDSGLAFVTRADALQAAMAATAAYLPANAEERQPAFFTPEASRRARGVEVWAALRTLGRKGLADLVERTCRYASRFAERLRAAGFEVLNHVNLNQVMVSFGDDATTERVTARVQQDGVCWCGGTVWQGRRAMRISVSSWATTAEDVERSADAMIRAAAEVAASKPLSAS